MTKPPVAKKKPTALVAHGDTRIDNYFWLNNRKDKEVIDYINKENSFTKSQLKSTKGLQKKLYAEMKGRMKEDESSAPYLKNGYWYYERYAKGKEHPLICRKKGSLKNKEEVLLNENIEAKKYPYYEVVSFTISSDNNWMAFAEDLNGRRLYQIRFKNLCTGEILADKILNASSDITWHQDNITLYYGQKDKTTLRPCRIYEHKLGRKKDQLIFEEKDDTFSCGVSKSKDDSILFIGSFSSTTTEFRFKKANDDKPFEVFLKRKKGHEYYPEVGENHFILKSNSDAPNFKLMKCSFEKRSEKNWTVVQKHDPKIFIEDFELFKNYTVVQEKKDGLTRLRVYDHEKNKTKILPPFEQTYTLYIGTNAVYDTKVVRIGYSSLTTPHSVYDVSLIDLTKKLIKQTTVKGNFKASNYQSERVWAKAADGTKIPVSLVYLKKTFKKNGTNPLLVYGYGSYGSTIDPYFSSVRLSLLNRGFVFAIAHVRGGEDLGRKWYDDGKLLNKINTFTDFISCAEFLVKNKYGNKENIFAMGGSAGGLLMGVVANLKPTLWKGIVSQVPFVDVVTTMLDETIPLTTGEYDEWGNPNEKKYYEYMLSYSPYDNLEKKAYPAMLVISGLHDSQVQYWEPTKYVAKLRELKTDNNLVLLHTNMKAGHGGSSGRFEQLKEVAMEYAFLLSLSNASL